MPSLTYSDDNGKRLVKIDKYKPYFIGDRNTRHEMRYMFVTRKGKQHVGNWHTIDFTSWYPIDSSLDAKPEHTEYVVLQTRYVTLDEKGMKVESPPSEPSRKFFKK